MNAELERVFTVGNRSTDIDKILRGEGNGPNWFACADGTVLSVVAGGGTFCVPRNDTGPFSAVEVWWPDAAEPDGYVEVQRVRDFVAHHGGVVAVATDEQTARASAPEPAVPIAETAQTPALFEHAPGHRYGVQAGPHGMYARWCLRDDCDWRDTTKPQKDAGRIEAGALVATFLLCVIGISLFFLAVMGSRAGLCKVDASHSYCEQVAK